MHSDAATSLIKNVVKLLRVRNSAKQLWQRRGTCEPATHDMIGKVMRKTVVEALRTRPLPAPEEDLPDDVSVCCRGAHMAANVRSRSIVSYSMYKCFCSALHAIDRRRLLICKCHGCGSRWLVGSLSACCYT